MSKKTRILLQLTCVLVVCIAGYFITNHYNEKHKKEQAVSMAKDKIFALIQVHNGRIAELESEMQAELHEDKRKEISERIERLNVELGEKMLEIYNKYKKEL